MSTDAVAVLPPMQLVATGCADGWNQGVTPAGGQMLWRNLQGGILLHLGVPFAYNDADIHAAACRYIEQLPRRIWVFPDTAIPDFDTVEEVMAATSLAGHWVQAGNGKKTLLEDFGFSPAEAAAWQRDINSGDEARVKSAMDRLEQRTKGRDEAEIEAMIKAARRH